MQQDKRACFPQALFHYGPISEASRRRVECPPTYQKNRCPAGKNFHLSFCGRRTFLDRMCSTSQEKKDHLMLKILQQNKKLGLEDKVTKSSQFCHAPQFIHMAAPHITLGGALSK